jgi:hypothetical protein
LPMILANASNDRAASEVNPGEPSARLAPSLRGLSLGELHPRSVRCLPPTADAGVF